MIEIATPISHQFEDPISAEEIIKYTDCLEIREKSSISNWKNQKIFHFEIDIVHEWEDKKKNYLKDILLNKKELELITFQASRCCIGENIENGIFKISGKKYSKSDLLENSKKNIEWLKINFNNNFLIGVENNNYYKNEAYDYVTDGDFLSELIEVNCISFLFDIAHALVTSNNKNILFQDYISNLPLEKTIQLHICRPCHKNNGIMYDSHDYPNKDIFSLVKKFLINYKGIKFVTIEYYKDKKKLIQSLIELRKLINNIDHETAI